MTTSPPPRHAAPDGLTRGERCVLAVAGDAGPVTAVKACWSDGAGIWMTAATDRPEAAALRADPRCALWIPSQSAADGGVAGGEGTVVHGRARVFGVDDPVGLTLHGPLIAAAMGALAARNAGALRGSVAAAVRTSPRPAPHRLVVVRVRATRVREVAPPAVSPGVAPALPVAVPADVRRALAGRRAVVVVDQDAGLRLTPALWDAGPVVRPRPPGRLTGGVSVVVGPARVPGTSGVVGVAVSGHLARDGRLEPTEVTWWRGGDTASAPATTATALTLPE